MCWSRKPYEVWLNERLRLTAPASIYVKMVLRLSMLMFVLGTGEHGVGIGKRMYLDEELGEGTAELMRTVKRAIDPLGLFNPGKVSVGVKEILIHKLSTRHSFIQIKS